MTPKSFGQKLKIVPRALKAGDAAAYLGISRRYLHDLTKQGRIPCHRIGPRCITYDLKALDAFMDDTAIGGEA